MLSGRSRGLRYRRHGRRRLVGEGAWKGKDGGRCLAQECREEEGVVKALAIVLAKLAEL